MVASIVEAMIICATLHYSHVCGYIIMSLLLNSEGLRANLQMRSCLNGPSIWRRMRRVYNTKCNMRVAMSASWLMLSFLEMPIAAVVSVMHLNTMIIKYYKNKHKLSQIFSIQQTNSKHRTISIIYHFS